MKSEVPLELSNHGIPSLSKTLDQAFSWKVVKAFRIHSSLQVEAIEGVEGNFQFLDAAEFEKDITLGRDVSYLYVHYVPLLVDLAYCCHLSLRNCLRVLLSRFFLLLDDSFDDLASERSHKFVEAGFRVDGQLELEFHELVARIFVSVFLVDLGKDAPMCLQFSCKKRKPWLYLDHLKSIEQKMSCIHHMWDFLFEICVQWNSNSLN